MRRWLIVIAAVLMAPLAGAQSADAPHLSPEAMVLYAHGTGSDELNGFMNTLEEDGGDNAMGPSASCAPYEGIDLLADDVSRTYTFTLDPGLGGDVLLDTATDIEVVAHLGASNCDGDEVDVVAKLAQGDTVVAESDAVSHTWAGGAPYAEVAISMTPQVDTLVAGEDLLWTLQIDGTYYGQLFLGISDDQGHTRMTLPVLAVDLPSDEPEPIVEELTGDDATASITLNGTEVRRYDWSAPEGPWSAFLQGNVSAGSVTVQVLDGLNATLLDETYDGAINTSETLEGHAGPWRIYVNTTDATGSLSFIIGPVTPDTGDGMDDGTDGDGTDGDGTDGADGNATDDDGKDSPALAPALALALLAMIAIRRRR